jgi:methylated-DNA-protein-cysteine methyltransferase-like protein
VSFAETVWRWVRRIPRGRVATYGQIAALAGRPRAARAVGHAMHDCPPGVPWHRVVNASGGISRRARMESMLTQRILLLREGVTLRNGRVRLARHRWQPAMNSVAPALRERGESLGHIRRTR